MAAAPYSWAAYGSLDEARVTERNRHKLFLRYIHREFGMPRRHQEAAQRSLVAFLSLDAPYLILRAVATACMQVPASPMIAKNVICIVFQVRTIWWFLDWRYRGGVIRQAHQGLLASLDQEVERATAGQGERGNPLAVWENVGGALDRMEGPQNEFLEVYLEDIPGHSVEAATGAYLREEVGLMHDSGKPDR